jgi:hypothetical protein
MILNPHKYLSCNSIIDQQKIFEVGTVTFSELEKEDWSFWRGGYFNYLFQQMDVMYLSLRGMPESVSKIINQLKIRDFRKSNLGLIVHLQKTPDCGAMFYI